MNLDEIKSRINPAYQNQSGTESHERKWLCDQIDKLTTERDELKGELLSAAMESTPTAQIERQRKTILELQNVLREAKEHLYKLIAFTPRHLSDCSGYKCREPYCISCNEDELANQYLECIFDECNQAHKTISKIRQFLWSA